MAAVSVLRNTERLAHLKFRPNRIYTNSISLGNSCRKFSSESSQQKPSNAIQVPPPPSWSVSELRLNSADDDTKQDKISEEELATLARRCLIDVRRLSPDRRDQLRVDIAGIMRCASVLLDSEKLGGSDGDNGHVGSNNRLSDQEVYDHPRGLGRMPLRRDTSNNEQGDDWQLNGLKESNGIMQTDSVKSRIVEDNGEQFFSVVTKR